MRDRRPGTVVWTPIAGSADSPEAGVNGRGHVETVQEGGDRGCVTEELWSFP
jgi:hypothetical protein